VATLKEDFKVKERDGQEMYERKVAALEDKMNDLRSRLKRRDEEYNEMERGAKEEKRLNSEKVEVIAGLEQRLEVLHQEMEAQMKQAQTEARLVEERMEEERRRMLGELEESRRSLCSKELEARDLQVRLEEAAEALDDLEGERKKLSNAKMELEERHREALATVAALEQDIGQKVAFGVSLQDTIRALEDTVAKNLRELQGQADSIEGLQQDVKEKVEEMAAAKLENEHCVEGLRSSLRDREAEVARLQDELTSCGNTVVSHQRHIEALSALVQEKALSIDRLEAANRDLQLDLSQTLDRHKDEIHQRELSIKEVTGQLAESTGLNETLSLQLKRLEDEIAGLNSLVVQLREELEQKRQEYEAKEAELNWIYAQKLEEANHEARQKEEILRLQV
jgi:chromosome segregation ATPase